MRPFLKFAGNKFAIVDRIKEKLPPGERLIEPFCGSGAVSLNTDYPSYLLNDINNDIINLYQTVQSWPNFSMLTKDLYFNGFCNNAEVYYQLRDAFNNKFPEPVTERTKASLFVYLNRHGYNGLIRYNKDGGFNVPFGRYDEPYYPEKEMESFRSMLRRADLSCRNFEDVMLEARPGDVIYCDPPYVPLNETSNFTAYTKMGFSYENQVRLAEVARRTAERGISVLLSNHDTDVVRDLYQGAGIESFEVQRYISCKAEKREKVKEVLILFKGE